MKSLIKLNKDIKMSLTDELPTNAEIEEIQQFQENKEFRKLATIRIISDILPIEGADFVELAIVDGWQCVTNKENGFKVGDYCVYFEIDSLLPETETFEFLRKKHFRIRTQKLRGTLSQGLIMPLSIVEKVISENLSKAEEEHLNVLSAPYNIKLSNKNVIPSLKLSEIVNYSDVVDIPIDLNINVFIEENDDVTEILGVKKYEKPIPAQLSGKVKGNFPSRCPKTDATRIQNLTREIPIYRNLNMEFVAPEKLDGSSATFMILDDEFQVCSRNLNLKEEDDSLGERTTQNRNTFWKVAREQDIETKLRYYASLNNIKEYALQGELIGEGIQGNKYKLKGHDFYLFNIFNIDKQEYFSWEQFQDFVRVSGLKECPVVIESFKLKDESIKDILTLAEGKSSLNKDIEREGIVFRTKELISDINNYPSKQIMFKSINNNFLLKYGDD